MLPLAACCAQPRRRGAAAEESYCKMQSFGIKIERIDRDLLCIYETNAKWASVHICSVKWAEAKGDLDLRFKVVLWSTLT